jgi:uncharacterized membrane protein
MRVDQPASRLLLASVLVVFAALSALATLQLPAAPILPALSTLLVFGGFGLAAVSHLKSLRTGHVCVDWYTVAGLLVYLGFAAALLTDAEQTLTLIEEMEAHELARLAK